MHDQSSLSLLYAADSILVLRVIHIVQHEVVLLVQGKLLTFPLACHARAVQTHIQVVLDWPQLVPVLRSRHLTLMEIHCTKTLNIVSVFHITVNLIFETSLVRLITHLTIVPIDSPEYPWTSQASIVDLVVIAARMDF